MEQVVEEWELMAAMMEALEVEAVSIGSLGGGGSGK